MIADEIKSISPVTNKIEFEATIVGAKLYYVWIHLTNQSSLEEGLCVGIFDTFDGAVQACIKIDAINKIHLRN